MTSAILRDTLTSDFAGDVMIHPIFQPANHVEAHTTHKIVQMHQLMFQKCDLDRSGRCGGLSISDTHAPQCLEFGVKTFSSR